MCSHVNKNNILTHPANSGIFTSVDAVRLNIITLEVTSATHMEGEERTDSYVGVQFSVINYACLYGVVNYNLEKLI